MAELTLPFRGCQSGVPKKWPHNQMNWYVTLVCHTNCTLLAMAMSTPGGIEDERGLQHLVQVSFLGINLWEYLYCMRTTQGS